MAPRNNAPEYIVQHLTIRKNRENLALNKNLFESKWKRIRSQTTTWWSLMSDVDLVKVDKADNKFGKYVTLLQVKYGFTRDQAKKEVSRRLAAYEAESVSSVAPV